MRHAFDPPATVAADADRRIDVWPVCEHRVPVPAVDDDGGGWRLESTGHDPVTVCPELVVELVDRCHLGRSTRVGRAVENVVTPTARAAYRLEDLLAEVTAENMHTAIDAGVAVGGEAW